MINKYPAINCKAETGFGLDKREITITERKLQDDLKVVNDGIKRINNP